MGPLLECEVNEDVLVHDDGGADAGDLLLEIGCPNLRVLLHEGAEQPNDGQAVQRLVTDGPGHDLAHALHLVVPREIQQDRE